MINKKRPELLSPAGNMACLKAAIEAGCDAVYLAGKMFGARGFAGNFTNDEIIEAINYAHLYGVKVYITINTIIYEREVENFLEFVRFIHKNNCDAVIIQDLGMLDLVRKKFPNLEVHISTQVNIHNYEGALFAKNLGIKRVVMARETPLDVITKIKNELDIEVEVFTHGALCMSYSGQCLASALIGSRSGNRGTCAQICRKKYTLLDENDNEIDSKYFLSTKDLCTLDNIDKLIDANIDSFKIEGRMKRCEYVYLVTSIYRKVIDNYLETKSKKINEEDILELKKMFNRKFTKGFMLGEENNHFTNSERPNHMGIEVGEVISKKGNKLTIKLKDKVNINDGLRIIDSKEDKGLVLNKFYINNKLVKTANKGDVITINFDKYVQKGAKVVLTTSYNQIKAIDERLKLNKRKVLIDAKLEGRLNNFLTLKVTDGKNEVTVTHDKKLELANNYPTKKDVIIKQLKKTGDTVYQFKDIKLNLDDNLFINIKDINNLRRKALDELNNKRLYQTNFIEKGYTFNKMNFPKESKLCTYVEDEKTYEKVLNNYDVIYTNNPSLIKNNCILKLDRIIEKYDNYDNKVMISEVGGLLKYNDFETDFSFNITNSYALYFLHELGSKKVTLSLELTLKQIKYLINGYKNRYNANPNCEVIINSYPTAMICKYNLLKKYNLKSGKLKDEFGNNYKVISRDNYMIIKHYEKINNLSKKDYYEVGVNSVRECS